MILFCVWVTVAIKSAGYIWERFKEMLLKQGRFSATCKYRMSSFVYANIHTICRKKVNKNCVLYEMSSALYEIKNMVVLLSSPHNVTDVFGHRFLVIISISVAENVN